VADGDARAAIAAADDETRRELVRRASLATRTLIAIGPLACLTLVLVINDDSPAWARVLYVVADVIATALAMYALSVLIRALRRPRVAYRVLEATAVVLLCFVSTAWPAAFLVLQPDNEYEIYLVVVFALTAAALSLAGTAGHRPYFLALVLPSMGGTIAIILSGRYSELLPTSIALMGVLFVAILYIAWRQIHRTLLEAVGGRLVEEALSDELSEANARLVHRATHDDLTGLANRALFRDVLDQRVASARQRGTELALLYLDLDRFKVVNDSLGHAEGDALLQAAAERLRRCVRGDDLLARLGGDEFTLVAPDVDADVALAVAERIRREFEPPFVVGGHRTVVNVSIGVALSAPGLSALDLMRYADAALYVAKDDGRNRVVLFDRGMEESLSTRLERENELRDALESQQFEAWYQPLVDPRTRRIVGAEALARWRRSDGDVVAPGMFLPLMAEVGLTTELDSEIARQARAWRHEAASWVGDGFRVFTNVSAGQLPLEAVIELHVDAAEHDRTPLGWIGLEITEQAVVANPAAASAALTTARDKGLAVVLDDVGTGYSSLSLIKTLPVDGLKIDGTFVHGMLQDTTDAAVVASVAALGRRLGLHVTAEGVETEPQLTAVTAEGVSSAQGYLFSKPVPGDELLGWLRDGAPWLSHTLPPSRRRADGTGTPTHGPTTAAAPPAPIHDELPFA
jgi:diguanylate cyclase (GGDEF)-like protein